MVLLVAGCQNEVTSDNGSQGAADKREERGQSRHSGTTIGENGRKSDEIAETLGLLTKLVENCNDMLRKLSGRQEAYESANNAQGELLMAQATENVKDIKSSASSLKREVRAADSARDTKDEAFSIQTEIVSHRDGRIRSTGKTAQAVTASSQLAQEKLDAIEKSTQELEANLAEAERCCNLPPGFLDSNLKELHAQTTSIEILTEQMEFEQPTAEPTAPPTASPTASPTAQPTQVPTASPTTPATAEPTDLR